MPITPARSVLVVDESAESREVFRTALGRHGTHVLEAAEPELGLELARTHRPDLIVLDLEFQADDPASIQGVGQAAQAGGTPLIVFGTARRQARNLPVGEFIAKPYRYDQVIRRIEELLG